VHAGSRNWHSPNSLDTFFTSQFDGYPPLDLLHKIQYTPASETRQTIFTMPVVTAITVQKSTVFPA
jgi:hypothetical protein